MTKLGHNLIGGGGHTANKKLYWGWGGHSTYFLDGGKNWGGGKTYTGRGDTEHTLLMGEQFVWCLLTTKSSAVGGWYKLENNATLWLNLSSSAENPRWSRVWQKSLAVGGWLVPVRE